MIISLGAAQVIETLCVLSDGAKAYFEHDVEALSARGYRVVAVAVKKGGGAREGDVHGGTHCVFGYDRA